jgi:hypothetical protein
MSRQRFLCTAEGLVPLNEAAFNAERVAPDVMGDLPAYESPITGELIDGRRARREDLKRHNCRPYDAGEREEFERRKQARDAKLEAHVNETVERWWANASGDKREALARALDMGLTTEYARREGRP